MSNNPTSNVLKRGTDVAGDRVNPIAIPSLQCPGWRELSLSLLLSLSIPQLKQAAKWRGWLADKVLSSASDHYWFMTAVETSRVDL